MSRHKSTLWLGFALASVLPLAGCLEQGETASPFVVNVSHDNELCTVSVHGRRVTGSELLQLARSSGTRRAIIVGADAPYRCIGGAIVSLQKAGFVQIDFAEWNPG